MALSSQQSWTIHRKGNEVTALNKETALRVSAALDKAFNFTVYFKAFTSTVKQHFNNKKSQTSVL